MSSRIPKLFREELRVVNIGLEIFYQSLKNQGLNVLQVNWQPPPPIEKELKKKLEELL